MLRMCTVLISTGDKTEQAKQRERERGGALGKGTLIANAVLMKSEIT